MLGILKGPGSSLECWSDLMVPSLNPKDTAICSLKMGDSVASLAKNYSLRISWYIDCRDHANTVDPYIFTLWSWNFGLFASKTRCNHQGQRVQQTSGWFCFQTPLTILQIYYIYNWYIYIYKNPLDTKASLKKPPADLVGYWGFPPSWLAWGAIYTEVSEVGSCQSRISRVVISDFRGPWKPTAKEILKI